MGNKGSFTLNNDVVPSTDEGLSVGFKNHAFQHGSNGNMATDTNNKNVTIHGIGNGNGKMIKNADDMIFLMKLSFKSGRMYWTMKIGKIVIT